MIMFRGQWTVYVYGGERLVAGREPVGAIYLVFVCRGVGYTGSDGVAIMV
jgi:hypothetical protein